MEGQTHIKMSLTKLSRLFKKYLTVILILLLLAIVGGWLVVVRTPPTNSPQASLISPSLVGVEVGKTNLEELYSKLGSPDEQQSKLSEGVYAYPVEGGGPAHKVIFEGERVGVIKETILGTKTFQEYKRVYGEPERALYTIPEGFKFYVYTKLGVGVKAHDDGSVDQVWYFPPMSVEELLKKPWAENVSVEPLEHEEGF